MKKNIIKSCLLLVSMALSVYGVLHWKHTVVDPPQRFDFENCHNVDLAVTISKVSSDSLEIGYQECLYKLRRYQKEGLINDLQANLCLEDLYATYTPKFISQCNLSFSNHVWDKRPWNHSFMKKRIAELKQQKKYDGTVVIESSSDYINQMDTILITIEKYDKAWELSTWTKYKSIATTKERVKQANEYKKDSRLKNCSELVKALNELPSRIKTSHIGCLKTQSNNLYCAGLDYYKDFSEELITLYDKTIKDYEDYYNTTTDTKTIKSDLRDKQYKYLKEYSDYVLNVYHFDTWEAYKAQNEKVYSYFSNCVGDDSRIKELRGAYLTKFLKTEDEFNSARGISIERSAPKFA